MRKITAIILSVCLFLNPILIILSDKTSSTSIPIADAGPDQIVNEGEIVHFNGSGSSERLNILHVSIWELDELQMIIDYTGSTDKFVVTQVGLPEFNNGNPNNLSWFDAIVFGLSNHYEEFSVPIERTGELRDFVINGGGIVWTHDTLEYYYDYGPDLEEPAGMDFNSSNPTNIGLHIPNTEIIMDHEILHNLFEIGDVGEIIPKTPYPPPWYHYTHTGGGNVTTADIIIQHDTTPGSLNFYLTTHEYGQGRVALDEIGHTVISGDGVFLGLPSSKECQILVNAIYWVTFDGNVTEIISYSWDFDANIDSDGDGDPSNDVDATGPTPIHIYGDDGVYTVILNVTDDHGLSNTDTIIVTVNNVAPTIEPFGPFIIDQWSPLNIIGKATDPGSDDLTFKWNWGDNTSDTIEVYFNDGVSPDPHTSPFGNHPFSVNSSVQHIFRNYGIYIINLTVEDDDGGVTVYLTNVTVIGIALPILYINTSLDGKDVVLYWEPPLTQGIEYYLIYRSASQIDFNFSKVWVNTSKDKESGESSPIPLRTMWNDTNAAFPSNETNYEEQYYYVIRAVNEFDRVSGTSRTVGKWTKMFPKGISTFSLPLEPINILDTYNLTTSMKAEYIKYMDHDAHIWRKHDFEYGTTNNTQMKLGEGYEVKFKSQTYFTFTGMPGAMISYDDDNGFLGFDPASDVKSLVATVETNGNVNLTWEEPTSMDPGDWYEIYYSNNRDGFFKSFNKDYFLVSSQIYIGNNTITHINAQANNLGSRLYYMIIPFNVSGVRGSSTYSIGIWTEECLEQYDTFGIPLKLKTNHTADFYCDNIPDCVGINYYDICQQRWCWHSMRMNKGIFDPSLLMTDGYQISTSNTTKFTFIGI